MKSSHSQMIRLSRSSVAHANDVYSRHPGLWSQSSPQLGIKGSIKSTNHRAHMDLDTHPLDFDVAVEPNRMNCYAECD